MGATVRAVTTFEWKCWSGACERPPEWAVRATFPVEADPAGLNPPRTYWLTCFVHLQQTQRHVSRVLWGGYYASEVATVAAVPGMPA